MPKTKFDKKHYNEIKRFMDWQLNHRPFQSTCTCPFKWAKSKVKLVSYCVSVEDYEGAKACKDAIKDFLNKFLPVTDKITDDDTLNLPEYIETKISGIICFQDGTADWI